MYKKKKKNLLFIFLSAKEAVRIFRISYILDRLKETYLSDACWVEMCWIRPCVLRDHELGDEEGQGRPHVVQHLADGGRRYSLLSSRVKCMNAFCSLQQRKNPEILKSYILVQSVS